MRGRGQAVTTQDDVARRPVFKQPRDPLEVERIVNRMRWREPTTKSVVGAEPGSVTLIRRGRLTLRACVHCGGEHLALPFAPADAPCARCSTLPLLAAQPEK